jgi:hypothetical protein
MSAHCNNGGCTRPVYRGKECYRCWLGTKWDSMKARVENKRNHYPQWAGVALGINRSEFIVWGLRNPPALSMLQPSIDRIDSGKGYWLTNIQWLEARQNSRGAQKNVPLDRRRCIRCKKVKRLDRQYFHFNRANRLGFQSICIPCRSAE